MINNSQTRRDEAKKSIEALNAAYNNREMSYTTYMKKFKVLRSKFKSANSVANQMKDNGIKVTKKGGGYIYNGKNFSVEIFLDGCVTDFWTVYLDDNSPQILIDELEDGVINFERKVDAIETLFKIDMSM
tara:strand:+ start:54 stop:443 length:390 start_codon:yes stop_codon:yes gene_type:complete